MSDKKGNESDVILQVQDVTKVFRVQKNREFIANEKISLEIHSAETVGIVGESGCGKTTLARMLVLLDRPTEGKIIYRGTDTASLKGESLRQHRRKVQMIFQNPSESLNPKMKVKDIVCEPLLNFGLIAKKEVDKKAKELLRMVELKEEMMERYPFQLSGGQCQRVGIARALSLEPEILICDEATSALDASVQKSIAQLLAKLQKEKKISIVFICHDLALVRNVSHRVVVMYQGKVVETLPADKLGKMEVHHYTQTLMDSIFAVEY